MSRPMQEIASPDPLWAARFCLTVSRLQRSKGCDQRALRAQVLNQGYRADLRPFVRRAGFLPANLNQRAQALLKAGIQVFLATDPAYPWRLAQVPSRPLVLYARGKAVPEAWQRPRAITVIGSRKPSPYGRAVTRALVPLWCRPDTLVISGLARGIDGLAQSQVLDHGGMTLAVLAQGVDVAYPPEHRDLMEKVAQSGALVSEHEPGIRPVRRAFPARNRILSGLCDVVAVIEAACPSGSLITAGFAADQGRDVYAVPGSLFNPTSAGCHQLIQDGAGLLTLQEAAFLVDCQKDL